MEIRWRRVTSSNVMAVGWPSTGEPLMLVAYRSGKVYGYSPVSRQRAVALAYRVALWGRSIGKYLNTVIKPDYEAVLIENVTIPSSPALVAWTSNIDLED
jgi:hypothetical protein